MNKSIILYLGALLIVFGLLKPHLFNTDNFDVNSVSVTTPTDDNIKKACDDVIKSIKSSNVLSKQDIKKLVSLYLDLALLIELNGNDEIIKNTEEIRQANSLTGLMLRMDMKGKYPGLAESAKAVVVAGIGDDSVVLDSNLRQKASESFRALAWACNEGLK